MSHTHSGRVWLEDGGATTIAFPFYSFTLQDPKWTSGVGKDPDKATEWNSKGAGTEGKCCYVRRTW